MNIFGRMVERAKIEGQTVRVDTKATENTLDVASALAPMPSKTPDQMRAQARRTLSSEGVQDAKNNQTTEPTPPKIETPQRGPSPTHMSGRSISATTKKAQDNSMNAQTSDLNRVRDIVKTPSRALPGRIGPERAVPESTKNEKNVSEKTVSHTAQRTSVKHNSKTNAPAVKHDDNTSDITIANDYIESIRQYSRRTIEQQERSETRLRGLSGVLKQVELKLATFGRMEERLDAALIANKALQGNIDEDKERSQMLELRIKTLEPQYVALRDTLETARIDLSTQRDVIRVQKEKLTRFNTLLSKAATRVAETDSRSASVVQAYKKLQTEFQEQGNDLTNKSRRLVDLEKGWDAMAKKLAVRNNDYEIMKTELKDLKHEHEDLKGRYLDASGAFENARYEFKSQITLLNNKLLRRNEEYIALQSQLESFKSQVEETGGLSAYREREIVELKERVEAERKRVQAVETRLVDKAHLADMNARALERAKFEYEMLNEKYATALTDIDMFKNMALSQNQKLSRYAAVSGSIDPQETKTPASKLAAMQSPKPETPQVLEENDSNSFDPNFKTRAFVTPSSKRG